MPKYKWYIHNMLMSPDWNKGYLIGLLDYSQDAVKIEHTHIEEAEASAYQKGYRHAISIMEYTVNSAIEYAND